MGQTCVEVASEQEMPRLEAKKFSRTSARIEGELNLEGAKKPIASEATPTSCYGQAAAGHSDNLNNEAALDESSVGRLEPNSLVTTNAATEATFQGSTTGIELNVPLTADTQKEATSEKSIVRL